MLELNAHAPPGGLAALSSKDLCFHGKRVCDCSSSASWQEVKFTHGFAQAIAMLELNEHVGWGGRQL